jgi:hypothetical protein
MILWKHIRLWFNFLISVDSRWLLIDLWSSMYFDLEPSLHPASSHYKLEESRSISWKTYHLKACPGSKSRMIQYAELALITIRQTYPEDTQVHFAQGLHTLKFTIRFRVCLNIYSWLEMFGLFYRLILVILVVHNKLTRWN